MTNEEATRVCRACGALKEPSGFYPRNRSTCKTCVIDRAKARYQEKRKELQAYQRAREATVRAAGLSCCYRITHRKTGFYYIGSTTCLHLRVLSHRSSLGRGEHYNLRLQKCYDLTGWDFDVEVLVRGNSVTELRAAELDLIQAAGDDPLCCNIVHRASV
jgi:DNA-binding Lrp family transcriptional regulator